MLVKGRVLLCAVMGLFFLAITVLGTGYPADVRFFPMIAAVTGLLLSVMQLITEIRMTQASGEDVVTAGERWKAAKIFLWLTGLVLTTVLAGILAASCLFLPVYFAVIEKFSKTRAVVLTGVFTLVLYLLFEVVFQLSLFPGLIVSGY